MRVGACKIDRPGRPGRLPHRAQVALLRQIVRQVAPRDAGAAGHAVDRVGAPVDRRWGRYSEKIYAAIFAQQPQSLVESRLPAGVKTAQRPRNHRRATEVEEERRLVFPLVLGESVGLGWHAGLNEVIEAHRIPRARAKGPPQRPGPGGIPPAPYEASRRPACRHCRRQPPGQPREERPAPG